MKKTRHLKVDVDATSLEQIFYAQGGQNAAEERQLIGFVARLVAGMAPPL